MNIAPDRGVGTTAGKEKAPQQQPGGPKESVFNRKPVHSPSAPENQSLRLVRARGEAQILGGNVVYQTTRADDPYRHRSAAAIAERILAQMRRLHVATGGPKSDLDRAGAWLDVALRQFVLIEASRPKWTFGPRGWARKYVAELLVARSPAWLEDQIRYHRQRRTNYTSAEIGNMLGVTREQFLAERLWHMWPAGIDEAERARLSKDIKAAWQRADRAKKGAIPRSLSLSRTEPWLAMGISRRTFERRRAAGKL